MLSFEVDISENVGETKQSVAANPTAKLKFAAFPTTELTNQLVKKHCTKQAQCDIINGRDFREGN